MARERSYSLINVQDRQPDQLERSTHQISSAIWGPILNGIGGALVAYGQSRISSVVYQWLRMLDMTVGHMLGKGDIHSHYRR